MWQPFPDDILASGPLTVICFEKVNMSIASCPDTAHASALSHNIFYLHKGLDHQLAHTKHHSENDIWNDILHGHYTNINDYSV